MMLSIHNMTPQRCSVLIFIFITVSVHCKSPSISIIPAIGDIYLGTEKHFLCKVMSGGEADLKWMTSDDEEIEDEKGLYKLKKIDESLLDLAITASKVLPERVIKCVGELDSGEKLESKITIKIVEKPTFIGDVDKQKTFMAGKEAILPCSVKGIPTPQLSWFRNGQNMSLYQDRVSVHKDGSLHIDKVQLSDAGMYNCHAHIAERDEEEYKNVTIIVNAPPAIQFHNSSTDVLLGSATTLICSVTGHPPPVVTWKRGVESVTEDGEKYILKDNGQELSIIQLDKSDDGEYTCTAENVFEKSSRAMLLQVIDPSKGLGKGVIAGIILLILLMTLLAVDLTCYRTKRRGFLMCIATNLLGKQTPGVKMQETEFKKSSADKSLVVNISGIEA